MTWLAAFAEARSCGPSRTRRTAASRRDAARPSSSAGDLCLEQADTLAIVVPATTIRRGWPNHVLLRGPELVLRRPTYAMTEQPRTISRERIVDVAGVVDAQTMAEVDMWLRDFLSLG